MKNAEEPGESVYLSRCELELDLARLALAVMRGAPDAAGTRGMGIPGADPMDDSPGEIAERLLRRTPPEHRPFVEARLQELGRCMTGLRKGMDATHAAGTTPGTRSLRARGGVFSLSADGARRNG